MQGEKHSSKPDEAAVLPDVPAVVLGPFSYARIFGFTEEVVGQPAKQLFNQEDIERGVPEHEMELALGAGIPVRDGAVRSNEEQSVVLGLLQ